MRIELEDLLKHEAAYYAFSSVLEKTDCAWYLSCSDLRQCREVNRAIRLRDDGRGPDEVVHSVVNHFRMAGTCVTAEIDTVSESQGIGFALRRMGITPVIQSRSLMLDPGIPVDIVCGGSIEVIKIDNGNRDSQIDAWIETNLHDVDTYDNAVMWRVLAAREAQSPDVLLYLALWEGQPASTCSLFQALGMGRIEMVETRSEYRRRGLASAVVAQATLDSANSGNTHTYLYSNTGSDAERLYKRLGFEINGVNVMHRHIEA